MHAAGDVMVAIALANTIFFTAPSDAARQQVVLYLALAMLPVALLTPVVDGLLARHAKQLRHTLFLASAIRVGLAAALIGGVETAALYPLALALLVTSRVHGIARTAYVPEILPSDRSLVWANTWLSATVNIASAIGAGIATAVVALTGASSGALFVAVGAYALSALVVLPRVPGERAIDAVDRDLVIDGDAARLPSRTVAAGVALAVIRFATGFLTFLLAFSAKDNPALFSALVAAAVIGGALGTFTAGAARPFMPMWALPPTLLAVLAFTAASAAWDGRAVWSFAVALSSAFAWAAGKVAFDGLTQQLTCPAGRRRVVVRYAVGFQVCWIVGAAVALTPVDASYALAALAVGCTLGLVGALKQAEVKLPSLASLLAFER
ncbi:hypothetical protein [Sporichthya polymorpha]|uniref:hypothetical protein n=1 Tax=Sporichthya polymorpha TaxID=35751 RepID=UPI000382B2ED|nr:hypothetical protein [Sporichthya polymorpha]